MKNFLKILSAMLIVGNIFASNVHAQIETYTGIGDYVLSEDVPPGDIKSKAKMYAEQNALEQAGVFVSGLTEVKNHVVSKDEIITIVGGILKIIDTKFEIIPLNDAAGIAKYRATVIAQVDTDLLDAAIKNWLNRDADEKANLVQQNKSQQETIANLQKRIAELEKQAAEVKTTQDRKNIQESFAGIDRETLAAQKNDEGNALYDQKNYQAAISKYTESINLNPNLAVAYYNRGLAYKNLKNYQQEIEDYTQAIKLNPNYAEAYNNRGLAYENLQNYSQAIEDYTKSIELNNPELHLPYNNRGVAYAKLQNHQQAIEDFTKAIKLNPNFAESYNNRGEVYRILQNYNQAISDYNQALKLGLEHPIVYSNFGMVYTKLKKYAQAMEFFKKAEELGFPDDGEPYYYRGICYQSLGRNELAEKDFAKARQLGYNG